MAKSLEGQEHEGIRDETHSDLLVLDDSFGTDLRSCLLCGSGRRSVASQVELRFIGQLPELLGASVEFVAPFVIASYGTFATPVDCSSFHVATLLFCRVPFESADTESGNDESNAFVEQPHDRASVDVVIAPLEFRGAYLHAAPDDESFGWSAEEQPLQCDQQILVEPNADQQCPAGQRPAEPSSAEYTANDNLDPAAKLRVDFVAEFLPAALSDHTEE